MKKYNQFIKEKYEDIDPYGEEDWDEDYDFKIGDKIICVHPGMSCLTKNKKYKVLRINGNGNPGIKNDNRDNFYYHKSKFKKKLNESHEDIDPYGEEDWDALELISIDYRTTRIKLGDEIYTRSDSLIGVVVKIVKSPFDGTQWFVISRNNKEVNMTKSELVGLKCKIKKDE